MRSIGAERLHQTVANITPVMLRRGTAEMIQYITFCAECRPLYLHPCVARDKKDNLLRIARFGRKPNGAIPDILHLVPIGGRTWLAFRRRFKHCNKFLA